MNAMLVLVLVIFGCYIYWGTRIGLMKMAFGVVASVVLLILSFVVSPILTNQLANNPKVLNYVEKKVDTVYETYQELSEERQEKSGKKKKESNEKKLAEDVLKKVGKPYVVLLTIRTAVFIGIYLVSSFVFFIIGSMLSFLSKLPVLKSLNRLAGGGLGGIQGLIVVWLLFMVMTIFMGNKWAEQGLRQIAGNEFLRILYDNNLLVKLLESFK